MATQERVVGHVVGSDLRQGREIWKVRPINGDKIVVASVHENVALASGLDVSFIVGTFKDGEQSVRKAIDVRPLSETREELKAAVRPSEYDSLSLVVMQHEDGERYVWLTDHETEQEAQAWARGIGKPLDFARFNIGDFEDEIVDFNEAAHGFAAINAISHLDGVGRALEQLITTAYQLGQRSQS